MAARLPRDRFEHRRMAVAQGGHADARDQIEIAAPVPGIEPGTLRARDFQADRQRRSLSQMAKKSLAQLAHRAASRNISMKASPPCGQSSGGDCICPGSQTYQTP